MHTNRLSLLGRLVVALLATFAFGAIAATVAQAATEGPLWTVEGKALKTNETREISIKAVGSITLEAELLTIKAKVICPSASVEKGSYLAGGSPGTSREVAEFGGGCTVINNGSNCKVKEPIRTRPIRAELVVSDLNGSFGPYILVEFKPEEGEKFVELEFTGTCTVEKTEVKGEVLGCLWTDPLASIGSPEEQVTTGNQKSLKLRSYLLRFPDPSPNSIWLLKTVSGTSFWELVKPKGLEAFGNPATLSGRILISLINGKEYGTEL
jgi:hypothetical protein